MKLGRFISQDSYTEHKEDPVNQNLYVYSLNNPAIMLELAKEGTGYNYINNLGITKEVVTTTTQIGKLNLNMYSGGTAAKNPLKYG